MPTTTSRSEPPDAVGEGSLADLVQKRYEWSRASKQPMLRTWATCLAFYVGEQWRRWDPAAKRLVDQDRIPSWRTRLTDNQVTGYIDTMAAKLSRTRSMPRCLANTSEPEDMDAANLGSATLEHWWKLDKMERKEYFADVSRGVFGCAFYHDYWDPSIMRRVPSLDPTTGMPTAMLAPVGDQCARVLTPLQTFPEPVDDYDDASWVIIASRHSLGWIRDMFGAVGRQVKPDSARSEDALGYLIPGRDSGSPPLDEGCATLLFQYERPSKRMPKGRMAITSQRIVLWESGQLPDPHGEIPVTMSPWRLVPHRMWPTGLVEMVIDFQRELNRSQSSIANNVRLHGNLGWLVPNASGVNADEIGTSPDIRIPYNYPYKPEVFTPPPLPAQVIGMPDMMRAAMQQVVGQHEVSNAQVPTGVRSGIAIGLLQDQDDSRLHVPAMLGRAALERVARHALVNIVQLYREPRLISTFGRDRAQQVMAIMGADIGDRDVVVDLADSVNDTDSAKRQRLMDYMASGIFNLPLPLQMEFFREMNEQWLLDAIQKALPQIQADQVAAAEQEAMMADQQAALQPGEPEPAPMPSQDDVDSRSDLENLERLARVQSTLQRAAPQQASGGRPTARTSQRR